ncbi:hypothetical protein QO004_006234 [Rhizobium mesoamericanum]|nr:hypothetical protein [Rhizobium mesoamericanum]
MPVAAHRPEASTAIHTAGKTLSSRLNGWPVCPLPTLRKRPTGACARLEADVARCAFTAMDLHHLLLAGLPAHQL